jgi:hypothetical protein
MNEQVVVVSVPFTNTTSPMMAPAALKGVITSAGFNCVGFDLNGIVYEQIIQDPDLEDFLAFFYYEEVRPGFENRIWWLFDNMARLILQHEPTTVCLSLLHYQCQVSAKWLSYRLKQLQPSLSIVIGGAGVFGSGLLANEKSYQTRLLEAGLIDYYIMGDGDITLPELLKGNTAYPGINSMTWQVIEDLNALPYPDYDDYDFGIYESPFLGLLGSRGCVRQCTFCDIHEYWDKFTWRTGQNIFDEMLFQNQKYGIRFFKFQDSLINGNVKEYNKLITLLAEHNRANPDNRFRWSSYFIFRPQTQMSEEQWRLTAESGAFTLNVGVESFVDKNRLHLKKKFTNQDLEYGLAMSKKYGIKLVLLVLIGYVTETETDHQESLEWIRNHVEYANEPIYKISIGGTLAILPGTWLARNQDSLGITWRDGKSMTTSGKNHLWEIKSTGNDYATRMRRMSEVIAVGESAGFFIQRAVIDPQKEIENLIRNEMQALDDTGRI